MTTEDTSLRDETYRLWQRGVAAWPKLSLELETFFLHVSTRTATPEAVALLNGEDLFLACACLHRIPGAVAAFEDRYRSLLERNFRRVEHRVASIEELSQELLVKLFVADAEGGAPKIAEYSGRGALQVWLRMAATRMALNLVRDNARITSLGDSFADRAVRSNRDVELSFIRGRYEEDFRFALGKAVLALSPDQRILLRLHYRERLTMDELAVVVRASRATANRRLASARESLELQMRAMLKERLRLSTLEMESLLRVVRSELAQRLATQFAGELDAASSGTSG